MSTTREQQQPDPNRDVLCAVLDGGQMAVVRVMGKGNFSNSMPLKKFASCVSDQGGGKEFVVDLRFCETMDSTFMGVLAGICIDQAQTGSGKMIIVNANEHCRRLLRNLGLTHIVELRDTPIRRVEESEECLKPTSANGPLTKLEQICLTLEAHKDLVKIDEQNEVRFQAVIEYLKKSYEDEGGSAPTT